MWAVSTTTLSDLARQSLKSLVSSCWWRARSRWWGKNLETDNWNPVVSTGREYVRSSLRSAVTEAHSGASLHEYASAKPAPSGDSSNTAQRQSARPPDSLGNTY